MSRNPHHDRYRKDGTRRGTFTPLMKAALDRDPAELEREQMVEAMSRDERVAAMRAGSLSLWQCLYWARRYPDEVPRLNGEFEFIAIRTPEVMDDDGPPPKPRTQPPPPRREPPATERDDDDHGIEL